MIPPLNNELYASSLELLHRIVPGESISPEFDADIKGTEGEAGGHNILYTISPEFDAYITGTAISIRYSGVIVALLDNENQGKAGQSGLPPSLVNRLLIKLLRQFFHYPDYLSYGTIKDICADPAGEALLKDRMLEILASLKFAVKTYEQSDSFRYSVNNDYKLLDAECGLNVQNFRLNNSPARRNGAKANLRLAYYSYLETANGYQSWFDQYGLETVNRNIHSNLGASISIFEVQDSKLPKPPGSEYGSFELKVGSRGLLVGTGYPHMNLMNEEKKSDFQLGFFFDHSTGFPLIPASSVKGFLRAGFPATVQDDIALQQLIEEMVQAGITVPAGFDFDQAKEMENALFGDMNKPARGSLFFNAYITRSTNSNVNNQGNGRPYLDEDWLAPHLYNDRRSRLREPNPIRFLKIVPGVVFRFSFLVDSTTLSGGLTITPQQKIKLYKILLTNRNLGAKHRSGFGSFGRYRISIAPGIKTGQYRFHIGSSSIRFVFN